MPMPITYKMPKYRLLTRSRPAPAQPSASPSNPFVIAVVVKKREDLRARSLQHLAYEDRVGSEIRRPDCLAFKRRNRPVDDRRPAIAERVAYPIELVVQLSGKAVAQMGLIFGEKVDYKMPAGRNHGMCPRRSIEYDQYRRRLGRYA